MEQYSREHGTKEQPSKKYFQASTLPDIIKSYPLPRKNMKQSEIERARLTGLQPPALNNNSMPRPSRSSVPRQHKLRQTMLPSRHNTALRWQANTTHKATLKLTRKLTRRLTRKRIHRRIHKPIPTGPCPITSDVPTYGGSQPAYGQMPMAQAPQQIPSQPYVNAHQPMGNMYQQQQQQQQQQQASTRTGRARASTMEQQQSGIPAAIQRVASHLDPTQPIRLQPSPAYYPPPPEGMAGMDSTPGRAGRRGSRVQTGGARSNRDFIRTLEERTLEEGYMGGQGQNPWH
ncbi:unnamed protein product [Parascedosporium putredinis]|uniref:Uncharacterized protein n=1 Tax=Parascedosporium putredinis TaxID=1442378 RepID=A0A9P1M810_9PEZI|nr:unnamed protein product [Parascedosporium putredinis]CAI7989288.1 unnamed protein product [Parascedosporium putredinis]